MPALFASTLLGTHDVQLTTFVGFGTFAMVVLADFGGSAAGRASAYAAAAAVGATLIVAGTLAGQTPWAAASAMLVVGFGVLFAGVFGGYAAAAQVPLLLAFVLAVSVPAAVGAIPSRVEGWLLASFAAALSALVLWPQHEREPLRERATSACHALAALLKARRDRAGEESVERLAGVARQAVDGVRAEYAATPLRPAGPTRRDRAFVELVAELDRCLPFASRWAHEPPGSDLGPSEEDRLERAAVAALDAAGNALTGGPPPDLAALDRAKVAQREAFERWAGGTLREGGRAEEVLEALRAGYRLRLLSYVVLALAANATIATGRQPTEGVMLPTGTPRLTGVEGIARRIVKTVRTHMTSGSSALHNSLRGAVGLALAVLLARLLGLDHAFWTVLGTLSVLRSNALATGRTTLQALAGTLVGFLLGAPLMMLIGPHVPALWIALPIAVFLAAYTPTAVHFVVGQAAFTILVIVLFNLIAPAGWTVGLVRIEDIALGTGVSVAVGLLLWPRGARSDLRRALAQHYRAVAAYLAGSLHRLLAGDVDVSSLRAEAVRAGDRAGEAFDQLLMERTARRVGFEVPASLVAAGNYAIFIADQLGMLAARGYRAAGCPDETHTVDRNARLMVVGFLHLADRLDDRAPPPAADRVEPEALQSAASACLREWAAWPDGPAGAGRTAMTLAYCAELVVQLVDVTSDLEATVDSAIRAARIPWWR